VIFPSFVALSSLCPVKLHRNGFALELSRDWCIQGETRLSYSTAVFLLECCRDFHWQRDIAPLGVPDSITRYLEGDFANSIGLPTQLRLAYNLETVDRGKYWLRIGFHLDANGEVATFRMLSLFVSRLNMERYYLTDEQLRALRSNDGLY